MKDPFFIQPSGLGEAIKPLCDSIHLYTLPYHIHEIFFAFGVYSLVFEYLAPYLSNLFLPKQYSKLAYDSKLRWNMHCASMLQCCIISTLALWTMAVDEERRSMNHEERMWGYTGAGGLVQALATGYFLFDLAVMIRYTKVFGTGMLAHASSCVITYTLGFRPIGQYYGAVFVLYELSTFFLNIHWFFDKLNMTGTKPQLYNGIALLVVFFCCRLVWGAYSSFNLYKDVWIALHLKESEKFGSRGEMMRFAGDRTLPYWLVVVCLSGHMILQGLNVWWFGKMVEAVKKRFTKEEKKA